MKHEYPDSRVNTIAVMKALNNHLLLVTTEEDLKYRGGLLAAWKMTGPTRDMVAELYKARLEEIRELEKGKLK